MAAGRNGGPEARKALAELCELYWYPLYAFVRYQGLPAEEAKDLTQGFFTRLLEKNEFAVADPTRGRFRAWLLTSVKHYLANEWDRERAKKRGGNLVRLGLEDAEAFFSQHAVCRHTPERAYVRRWAEKLLQHVLETLGEEYERDGKASRFEKVKKTLIPGDEDSYASIAAELGTTAGAVRTEAFRLRKRFRELLLVELSHTVGNPTDPDDDPDPEDIADELRFLLSSFEDEDEE